MLIEVNQTIIKNKYFFINKLLIKVLLLRQFIYAGQFLLKYYKKLQNKTFKRYNVHEKHQHGYTFRTNFHVYSFNSSKHRKQRYINALTAQKCCAVRRKSIKWYEDGTTMHSSCFVVGINNKHCLKKLKGNCSYFTENEIREIVVKMEDGRIMEKSKQNVSPPLVKSGGRGRGGLKPQKQACL